MQLPKSRLPKVGTTIFTVMSSLASESGAINLGQGFPDFPMNEHLQDAVDRAMRNGHNQYAPMPGLISLREAIAEKAAYLYGTNINPSSEITITPGGTYAIYTAFTSFLQPGDEVIVFEPCYDSYIPNIEINGAIAIRIPLRMPDFSINWQAVDHALSPKTRAIIINSPHNPSGSVRTGSDMAELSKRVANTDIIIVSDEVYEHIIFDGLQHESILRYPELMQRSFVCFSFGKLYNCTGWKMGYCIAPPPLTAEFRKVHQFNAFSVNTPMQEGLADFLADKNAYLSLSAEMQARRDLFVSLMQDTPFTLRPSHGSYFICASYERISQESDKELALRLTKEAGVATIPVSAFYQDLADSQLLRFCFCKKEDTLKNAVGRLQQALSAYM